MKRGGPLRRNTPLRSRTPLRRTVAMRREGAKAIVDRLEVTLLRDQLLRRSGGKCEARFAAGCMGEGNQVHHVLRRSQGGKNTLADTVWICGFCHRDIHGFPKAAMDAGLLRRSTDR